MRTKILNTLLAVLFISTSTFAQDQEEKEEKGFVFTDVIDIENTSVKNQYRSGTCWSFSGLAFVEAELLRTTGKKYDLSEMFVVSHTYSDKATKYVRLAGNMNFGAGAEFSDVLRVIDLYGMVP